MNTPTPERLKPDPRGLPGYVLSHPHAVAESPLYGGPVAARYVADDDLVQVVTDEGDVLETYSPTEADRRLPLDVLLSRRLNRVIDEHREVVRLREKARDRKTLRSRQDTQAREARNLLRAERQEAVKRFADHQPEIDVSMDGEGDHATW